MHASHSRLRAFVVCSTLTVALSALGPDVSDAQPGRPRTDVNVVNTPDVRDADNPGRHSFQYSASAGALEGTDLVIFTVPPGQRAVLKYTSIGAALPPGQRALAGIVTQVADDDATDRTSREVLHRMVLSMQGSFGDGRDGVSDVYVAGQDVQFYADPGTAVKLRIHRSAGDGVASVTVSVAGYYVRLP